MSKNPRTPKFKIGDIVYLVSGGPAMAVQEPIINSFGFKEGSKKEPDFQKNH